MRFLMIAILPLACLGCAKADDRITCPIAQPGGAGMLQESKSQISAMADRLGSAGEAEIIHTATELRNRHPSASRGEIINYLITARCPRINAEAALNKSDKQTSLMHFSQMVEKAVPASR